MPRSRRSIIFRIPVLSFGIDELSPVQSAALKSLYEDFGGGDVGRDGDVVHVAEPEEIEFVRFALLDRDRVAEEEQQVYLVAGDPRRKSTIQQNS